MVGVTKSYRNFSVTILADSVVSFGKLGRHRMISIEANYPRIIHAEVMTHRLKSINAASSRAIPIERMIQSVMENPFIPDRFPKSHKGMQANDWWEEGTPTYDAIKNVWLALRDGAVTSARLLSKFEVSKQLANRLLETFLMYKVIMSGTEWENLIGLRAHTDAQHEFQILAHLMLDAFNASTPNELKPGEWHLPFGDKINQERVEELYREVSLKGDYPVGSIDDLTRMIVTARCARISYNNFEGKDDYKSDFELYKQLVSSGHMSPLEHVARAMSEDEYVDYTRTTPYDTEFGWCGNVRGFIQLRKMFPPELETRHDDRLLEK